MPFDLTSNYFSIFGMPVSYTVDAGFLMQRYRELLQTVHPDRFASASGQERRLSLQYSTHINEALRVLKDPLERARYILELKGMQWDDEQTTLSDPGFLMQQMDLRESLSEVREQSDPLEAIAEIISSVSSLMQDNIHVLEGLLQSDKPEDLETAKTRVRKMQFINKMKMEAETLEATLEDEL
ncbi:MAG TPA: Fe-S protein assembly co-chaperone HscB [Gammaproteobacteria bacterium]|nr:Fe-S protein assembly co-chaperone HscB [Gammaproteobacteria bacterium]